MSIDPICKASSSYTSNLATSSASAAKPDDSLTQKMIAASSEALGASSSQSLSISPELRPTDWTSMSKLNRDMLKIILGFAINSRGDLAQLAKVHRSFYLTIKPALIAEFLGRTPIVSLKLTDEQLLAALRLAGPCLKKLDLSELPIDDEFINMLIETCPKLQTLAFSYQVNPKLTPEGIRALRGLIHLNSVQLTPLLPVLPLSNQVCNQIKATCETFGLLISQLKLVGSPSFLAETFGVTARLCPNLTELEILSPATPDFSVVPKQLISDIFKELKQLKTLKLMFPTGTIDEPDAFTDIPIDTQLEDLTIDCVNIEGGFSLIAQRIPELKKLNFHVQCYNQKDLNSIGNLTKLQSLSLNIEENYDLKFLSNLVHLTSFESKNIPIDDFLNPLIKLPLLTHISVRDMSGLYLTRHKLDSQNDLLPSLTHFTCSTSTLKHHVLVWLTKAKALKRVELNGVEISQENLQILKKLPPTVAIHISKSRIYGAVQHMDLRVEFAHNRNVKVS